MKLITTIRTIGHRFQAAAGTLLAQVRKRTGPELRVLLPPPPPRLAIGVLSLCILSTIALLAARVLVEVGLDENTAILSPSEITAQVSDRLHAITSALDTARDVLTADRGLHRAVSARNMGALFTVLSLYDSQFAARPSVAELYSGGQHNRQISSSEAIQENAHGFAVYHSDGRLLAWVSHDRTTVCFDTMLSGELLLPNRDKGVLLENEPIYAYLTSLRKIVSKEGHVEGYVMAKRQLEMKEPLASGRSMSFINDIHDNAGRDFSIAFGAPPSLGKDAPVSADSLHYHVTLSAEPGDPASHAGTLDISRQPIADSSSFFKALNAVWSIGYSLSIFVALLWLLVVIADPNELPTLKRRPLVARILASTMVLGALAGGRVLLSMLNGLPYLLPASFQDPGDFASVWGGGVVRNPLELFASTVFATAAAVMLWIIWMPKKQLVRDDTHKKEIETIVRRERRMLVIFALCSILVVQWVTGQLGSTVESIVATGPLRYLTIKQVLPAPGMLMMLLSFLGLGVTYLFFSSLVLTFALRAAIFLLPRRISLPVRILSGSAGMAVAMAVTVWAGSILSGSDEELLYRAITSAVIFLISCTVILIDAFTRDTAGTGASFLYKLPRSSRTILFILSGSAIIMAPLVASKQLVRDKLNARSIVEENAEVSIPELQASASNLLETARARLDTWQAQEHDTSVLRKTAFLIWLDGMRDHPRWESSVDIIGAGGVVESHFSTQGAASELHRLRGVSDSLLSTVRLTDTVSTMVSAIIPCFTASCTPAISSAIRYRPPGRLTPNPPLFISISLWTDLPALTAPRAQFDLLSSLQDAPPSDPMSEGGIVVAQYRPNMRRVTNAPSLDVPLVIPAGYLRLLQSRSAIWTTTTLDDLPYHTLLYRPASGGKNGEPPTIITASVPEPTVGRILEFVLRMNAIGLIYGALVVLVLLLSRQVATRRLRFTLKFRDRIFLIVLLIALVPLVVVTNVTRTLLTERARSEQQERLTRDALVIKDRISQQLEPSAATALPAIPHDLQTDVNSLSQIIGREFSVFDANGRLRAASRPELFESGMLPSILNSDAYQEVVLGRRAFYEQPVHIGTERYDAGYQPITSMNGPRLLGVVALATMQEQSTIESQIARTTSLIYGTFAALGLVLLGIGALFAARVASPVLALIRATERVAKGTLTTSIPVTREDEIGELMQAFNSMTQELEKSREIVAQTEREIAWKEMARQVAHEIKNPLTPMKLSVQHLEHAHETKDPNFNSIFRRVIRTVSEQIDVLTRIATEFSRFGAMPRRKWGPVSLRRVADSAVALFDADRSRIRFVVDVPKDLPLLHSDEDELRRAFVNLIRNAVQAIDGWGVIVIRAWNEAGMNHVKLSDTGSGMSEETVKHAFDPNFSTKTSGMGLGLALVKKTITDMSGAIRVESRLGHGTTFYIDLPGRAYIEEEE